MEKGARIVKEKGMIKRIENSNINRMQDRNSGMTGDAEILLKIISN
jgi:hypothetical protein